MKWWHRFIQRFRRKTVLKSVVHHAHPVRIPLNPSPIKPEKVAVYHNSPKSRANQTTGERHKNPLNVKAPSQPYWKGQVDRDSRGHAVFDDVAFGTRAAIITLRTYWITHNLRTVAKIISRWAPPKTIPEIMPGMLPAKLKFSPAPRSIFSQKADPSKMRPCSTS